MIKQALQIKSLFDDMRKGNLSLSMDHDFFNDLLRFQMFDVERFIDVAKQNNKKHLVENARFDKFYISTKREGVVFFILTDKGECDFIVAELLKGGEKN